MHLPDEREMLIAAMERDKTMVKMAITLVIAVSTPVAVVIILFKLIRDMN